MKRKTTWAFIYFLFFAGLAFHISAQHIVEPAIHGENRFTPEQQEIIVWLQKQIKPNLLKRLWQDPKKLQQLSIKNWYINPTNHKYQLDIVLHWTDRWSDSPMAIEGEIEFSYPVEGGAVFRTIGKTKNLIEQEQIRGSKIPGNLVLNDL